MSEQQSNTCEICGGIKTFRYKVEMLTAEQVAAQAASTPSLADPAFVNWNLCYGHPEPAQKHDGNLDTRPPHDDYHATVAMEENYILYDGSQLVALSGGYGDCENCRIHLDPGQFLSLLAWGEQNRSMLEGLVKGQEE